MKRKLAAERQTEKNPGKQVEFTRKKVTGDFRQSQLSECELRRK